MAKLTVLGAGSWGMTLGLVLNSNGHHVTMWEFEELISRHLVSYVQPDVIQCGGISAIRKIAAMAETQFIEVAPHCPGSLSSGLGLASLHVDFCTSNCH